MLEKFALTAILILGFQMPQWNFKTFLTEEKPNEIVHTFDLVRTQMAAWNALDEKREDERTKHVERIATKTDGWLHSIYASLIKAIIVITRYGESALSALFILRKHCAL